MQATHSLSLTSDLVASVDRIVPQVSHEPGLTPLSDDKYQELADSIMRNANGLLHIFSYGSLIWKLQAGLIPLGKVRAYGWRRSFCLNLTTFRATPEQPGLMLALDYGGCCDGILMRADDGMGLDHLESLLRREIDYAEDVPYVRWITVRKGNENVTELTFYAAPRREGLYVKLTLDEQAKRIAHAAGPTGTCAAYLHNTIVKLIEHSINDGYLWKLQVLVAQAIRASYTT